MRELERYALRKAVPPAVGESNRPQPRGVERLERLSIGVERLGALEVHQHGEGASIQAILQYGGGADDLDGPVRRLRDPQQASKEIERGGLRVVERHGFGPGALI